MRAKFFATVNLTNKTHTNFHDRISSQPRFIAVNLVPHHVEDHGAVLYVIATVAYVYLVYLARPVVYVRVVFAKAMTVFAGMFTLVFCAGLGRDLFHVAPVALPMVRGWCIC